MSTSDSTARTVQVALSERSYQIDIGNQLLPKSAWSEHVLGRQALLISDSNVAPLHLAAVEAHLRSSKPDLDLRSLVIPAGETSKSLQNAELIFTALGTMRANRDVTLLALGGGMIGDLVGFAAALWMRGVRFIQLPTSLLAMVDSSVGGKTAVNLASGKNLVGAFWQPAHVLIDLTFLQTLPEREFHSGMAEVIKYGLIADAEFFAWLEQNAEALRARDPHALLHAVERSCAHKAAIVGRDERELGERAHLNLGHTFGHALETFGRYESHLHGEAVAIGMVMALRLGAQRGELPAEHVTRLCNLLATFDLPRERPAHFPPAELLELMRLDKKNRSGQIRLILLEGLGAAKIAHGDDAEILRAWS